MNASSAALPPPAELPLSDPREAAFHRFVPALLLGLGFMGELVALRFYRFDSDEPQHLHVVWAWTHGLLQYRDVFDNHAPLFHLMMAPLLSLAGERPEVLYLMRAAMLPFYFASLYLAWRMGRTLFDARAALWGTAFLALFPSFLLKSAEFRNDNPWLTVWMVIMTIVISGSMGTGAMLGVGLLFGLAAAISMKSVMLAGAWLLAEIGLLLFGVPRLLRQEGRFRRLLALTAGALVIPAAVAIFFWSHGALGDLYFCVIRFNELYRVPTLRRVEGVGAMLLILLMAIPLAARLYRGVGVVSERRLLVFLTALIYTAVVFGFWPIVTTRDFAPVYPLLALLLAGFLVDVKGSVAVRRDCLVALVVLAAFEGMETLHYGNLWHDQTGPETRLISDTLRLTTPVDVVMDLKGETVYRSRATYAVLEKITRAGIEEGLLPDHIVADVQRRHCAVVAEDSPNFPPGARTFFRQNYLDTGSLRIAGQLLDTRRGQALKFFLPVEAPYAMEASHGTVAGTLDGEPYRGERSLSAGPHTFVPSADEGMVAIFWGPALRRGFVPLALRGQLLPR